MRRFLTIMAITACTAGLAHANPVGMIWSGAMMLDFLGERAAHDAILKAIETVLAEGPRTGDLGGSASTTEMGEAVAKLV